MEITKDKFQNTHLYPKFKISLEKFKSLIENVNRGAIFIHIPKNLLSFYFPLIDGIDFKFYNYGNDHYTYYLWVDKTKTDKVPAYATSNEGVGALIFSPDQREILLVEEWGHWKFISGNVDPGENMITTLKREIKEEVNLEIEKDIYLIGGWQINKYKGDINENFHCFKVTATNIDFKVDGLEIKKARWFPIGELLQTDGKLEEEDKNPTYASIVFGEMKISMMTILWLRNYKRTHGLLVMSDGKYSIY